MHSVNGNGNDSRKPSPMRTAFAGSSSYSVGHLSPVADDLHPVISAGRVALITGAACGIGQAAAHEFAKLGLKVAIADINEEKLTKLGKQLESVIGPENVLAIPTDVSKLDQVIALRDRIYEDWGEVAVLMNNAGIADEGHSWKGIDNWKKVFDINVFGIVNVQQTFVPSMLHQENEGMVINTGSKQGITNPPGNAAYNASKAAVKSLTESLAHELRNRLTSKVTAHLFIPGWTYTSLTAAKNGTTDKPAGAWSAQETVLYLLDRVRNGDFYILCPDNEVRREVDQLRILWAAGDVAEGRPALSRWHANWKSLYEEFIREGLASID